MTAVDFAAFVDQLADASGDAIKPYFRTSLAIDDKGGVRGFDGAALSLMKPEGPDQERPARPPVGSFCWETLTTADVERAQTFWSAVCGWQTFAGGGMPTFGIAAGMENQVADIQPVQGRRLPNWLTYVVVEKIEPSCDKAAKLVPNSGTKVGRDPRVRTWKYRSAPPPKASRSGLITPGLRPGPIAL